MFDMSTPYNPMGGPLAILLTVIFGGLGTIYSAVSHTQWKCAWRARLRRLPLRAARSPPSHPPLTFPPRAPRRPVPAQSTARSKCARAARLVKLLV